jgi:hypothetical protein
MGSRQPRSTTMEAENLISGDMIQAWNQINTTLAFGSLTAALITTDLAAANTLMVDVTRLETQLNDKRNQSEAALAGLWDKVKRTRTNFKGSYGDDSYQYNLVGGTRISERKPRTCKQAE